ncbi:MAG: hypothetical protein MJ101_03785 [Clostridia bacterium]|nr:hypothetical protein [Clostridia bacterium]
MEIIHKITLDVLRGGVQAVIPMTCGDTNSHTIVVTMRSGADTVSFGADESAVLTAKKPDGTELVNSCTVYTSGGVYPDTVRYTTTAQTLSSAGAVCCRVTIINSRGTVLYSPEFAINVIDNAVIDVGSQIQSMSEYTALINAKLDAEAWAIGTKGGASVDGASSQYHNNAKYYADQLADFVSTINEHTDAVAPYVLPNGNWAVYDKDTSEFVDSGIRSYFTGEITAGNDGYTPVRGTDYWTDEDIAEIKAYIDDAILDGEW